MSARGDGDGGGVGGLRWATPAVTVAKKAVAVETGRGYRAFRVVLYLKSVVALRLLLGAQTFPAASISFLIHAD